MNKHRKVNRNLKVKYYVKTGKRKIRVPRIAAERTKGHGLAVIRGIE